MCLYMTFENTAVHWALAHWGFVYVCSCFFFFFFPFVCSAAGLVHGGCVSVWWGEGVWIFAAAYFL